MAWDFVRSASINDLPNSNPNSRNEGITAVLWRGQLWALPSFRRQVTRRIGGFFIWYQNSGQNQHSCRLQPADLQTIVNNSPNIDSGVKSYRILKSLKNQDQKEKRRKIYSKGCPSRPLSGRSNLTGRFLLGVISFNLSVCRTSSVEH